MINSKTVTLEEICEKGSSNIAQNEIENNFGTYPIYGAAGFIKNVDFYKSDKPYIGIVKDGAGVGRVSIHPEKSSLIGTMQYIFPNENVDINYLAEFLKSQNLGRFYTGATIPHIYFKDYKSIKLNLPSLEDQRYIAKEFCKCNEIINKHKALLEKYDILIKSRFIEMFGDPVRNPLNWEISNLGSFIENANNGMARRGNDKNGKIVLRLVELQRGFIDYSDCNRIAIKTNEEKYLLKNNDFLFARVNGNSDNVGRCCYYKDIGEEVYHNDHIIRVHFDENRLNEYYLNTLLNSEYGKSEFKKYIKTSAGQYTIAQDGISSAQIPIPPLSLQNDFAAFVQQIDKSKFAVQKSLEKAETLYKSLMQEYFG